MILIFTNKADTHPTNVIKHLNSWGVSVFRLNSECLLSDYEFSWWSDERGCDFYIKNVKNGLELIGSEVTAIWDRRPIAPKKIPIIHNNKKTNKFIRGEALGFLQFIRYYLKDIYSIGNIVQDRPAASKMLQLAIANKLKIKTPDTIFGNTKKSFIPLLVKHEDISLKPIEANNYFTDDGEYVFYSRKAKSHQIIEQPDIAFRQTVSYLQNYIDKKYEIRITVCDTDLIACKIDSQFLEEDKGKNDWREGYDYGLRYEIIEVPEYVKIFCKKFLKEMNINFGCFDFILTPNDEYYFLECNPNGQWLWLEIETGYDYSKIIAKNLAKFESYDVNSTLSYNKRLK